MLCPQHPQSEGSSGLCLHLPPLRSTWWGCSGACGFQPLVAEKNPGPNPKVNQPSDKQTPMTTAQTETIKCRSPRPNPSVERLLSLAVRWRCRCRWGSAAGKGCPCTAKPRRRCRGQQPGLQPLRLALARPPQTRISLLSFPFVFRNSYTFPARYEDIAGSPKPLPSHKCTLNCAFPGTARYVYFSICHLHAWL